MRCHNGLAETIGGDNNPFMFYINHKIQIDESEFDFSFARSGGPGGQNVNKVNTKALLRWNVKSSCSIPDSVRDRFMDRYRNRVTRAGEIILQSQRYRDQGRNVEDCLERLRKMLLVVAVPPVQRRVTKPTRSSQRKRLDSKKRNSEKKKQRRKPDHSD